jgi:hypothetical protein
MYQLPAPMPQGSATTAPETMGFSGQRFHEPFHALVGAWLGPLPMLLSTTTRSMQRCDQNGCALYVPKRSKGSGCRMACWIRQPHVANPLSGNP